MQPVASSVDRAVAPVQLSLLEDLKALPTVKLISTVHEFESQQEPTIIACMETILKKAVDIHKLHQSGVSLVSGVSSESSESISRSRRPSELAGCKGPR
ncbi:hypothetical protein QE152_g32540 [Popillia japonica]|uniref:Uncharacterized protein n=1 Tax=Popillia japonica TaxID=7064 RepID=A0AAW1IZF6_POPJA